jgi:hypothetical protein
VPTNNIQHLLDHSLQIARFMQQTTISGDRLMRKTACIWAAIAALTAAPANAGNLSDPIVGPLVIVEDTASSSSGTAIVLLLVLLVSIPALSN